MLLVLQPNVYSKEAQNLTKRMNAACQFPATRPTAYRVRSFLSELRVGLATDLLSAGEGRLVR
jgi:hypothetical protein